MLRVPIQSAHFIVLATMVTEEMDCSAQVYNVIITSIIRQLLYMLLGIKCYRLYCCVLCVLKYYLMCYIDINECAASPCHVFATCTNVPGSFQCACNVGFTGDGFNCNGMYALR
jgi:hypothetical protein